MLIIPSESNKERLFYRSVIQMMTALELGAYSSNILYQMCELLNIYFGIEFYCETEEDMIKRSPRNVIRIGKNHRIQLMTIMYCQEQKVWTIYFEIDKKAFEIHKLPYGEFIAFLKEFN